jgi:hypothetical protein
VPGRITDELRRITREQSKMADPPEPEPAARSRETRRARYGPLVALGVAVVLAVAGWILVQRLMAMSRLQDCVMSGRKNCAPIDTSSPP